MCAVTELLLGRMQVKKTAFDQIFDHWLQKDSGQVNSRFWANEPNSSDLSQMHQWLSRPPTGDDVEGMRTPDRSSRP